VWPGRADVAGEDGSEAEEPLPDHVFNFDFTNPDFDMEDWLGGSSAPPEGIFASTEDMQMFMVFEGLGMDKVGWMHSLRLVFHH